MSNRDLKYWIALKWVEGVGNVGFKTLLGAFGSPQQVFDAPFSMLKVVPGIGAKAARQIKDHHVTGPPLSALSLKHL
jgi:DNA processing protein